MEVPKYPQDDFLDVMEMVNKLEEQMAITLESQEKRLAISALISCTINYMSDNSNTIEELVFYRNLFMDSLDDFIKNIRIN